MIGALHWLIDASVRNRGTVIALTIGAVAFAIWDLQHMKFDAFPDLTNTQVQVLTTAPGLPSEQVEQLITVPIERQLGGVPNLAELRSLSRNGVSAITAVFEDGSDPWLARQFVKERLDLARGDIPDDVGNPELAPPTTGLGEVYQFTVASDRHRPPELYRLLERDIAPRLRGISGVVEVNAWGGGSPQIDAVVDPFALAARGLPLETVQERLEGALGASAGGYAVSGAEQRTVRATANPTTADTLGEVLLRPANGTAGPVTLSDVADIRESGAMTVGLGTGDGDGEKLFVMVQLLAGADARQVTADVRNTLASVRTTLPKGVVVEPIYDRDKLVSNTLTTVTTSLIEGGLLVIAVLLLLLGDLRAGLLTASVIPMAMLGAFVGLRALGMSGNLMSLGAIDFGLIVDGTIVVTESIVALQLGREGHFGEAVADRAKHVARPVFFAIGILLLVYTPVVLLWGTEGKLFRPMAATVLLALGTSLVLTFTYVPAMASWVIRPKGEHQTWILRFFTALYRPSLRFALARPALSVAAMVVLMGGSVWLVQHMGVEFIPRLEEGDLVVQTERLPSLSPAEALRGASRVERVVGAIPEVIRVASRTGSPAVATDPMGLEEADILVQLKPRGDWRPGVTRESLVAEIQAQLEVVDPGAVLNFTQPIEMRFNELLEGITSDVGIAIYGNDPEMLVAVGQKIAAELETVEGAADVAAPTLEGVAGWHVIAHPQRLASYGTNARPVLEAVQAFQRGLDVGTVVRGQFRDNVRLKVELPAGVPLTDMPLVLASGVPVPLGELAEVARHNSPPTIERSGGSRRVLIEANVRGRDVGSFVQEARKKVEALELPSGYWLSWSGAYEQLTTATRRLALIVPAVLALIVLILRLNFGNWRLAWLIFLNVPVATSGGLLALWLRDLPISMSAMVGFIALAGIAVMNGIVLLTRSAELAETLPPREAAETSAIERFRPVLMTAAVAGIGFVPMAMATGVGAEVQMPLATVVIGGLVTSTVLTLLALPALFARLATGPTTASTGTTSS